MVTTRARAVETPSSGGKRMESDGGGGMSEYEMLREQRIRENEERLQRFGIHDLARRVRDSAESARVLSPRRRVFSASPNKRRTSTPLSLPPRRSSRLQNITPVSYVEFERQKSKKQPQGSRIMLEEGAKPEIYTEEHDKLLGDCETSWVLFVDGYGKDGKRVYDPVKGKTCHQCRQKTLGHRTRCSECDMVQGQFCGDCLYMRYGENVLEANKNPNWICPPCRGICNCSLCRIKKGWNPTGYLYRKVQNLGFKSVAHYLIQTRRSTSNTEDEVPNSQVSAKKSLIFTDAEESVEPNENKNDKFDEENMNFEEGSVEPDENKNDQFDEENMNFENSALKSSPKLENKQKDNENDGECNGGMELKNSSNLLLNNCSTPQNKRKKENKLSVTPIPNPNSIAGRLRSRDNISEESNKQSELKNSSDCDSSLTRPDKANKRMVIPSISPDSIAGRLRSRIKL